MRERGGEGRGEGGGGETLLNIVKNFRASFNPCMQS